MARKRMVDQGILTSEQLASLPIVTRYAWVALLLYVDDFGRGKDNVSLIRAHSWPLDEAYTGVMVASDMDSFEQLGMICRYEHEATRVFHIPSWECYQRVQHKSVSRLAPCPTHEPEALEAFTTVSRALREGFTPSVVKDRLEEVRGGCSHSSRARCSNCPPVPAQRLSS